MVKLKNKIITVDSLPQNNKIPSSNILITIISLLILIVISFLLIKTLIPYITATDINKITGKKIFITECNTKDYLIISKDKSYSLSITNNNCDIIHYEGNIIIKNNVIIFNKNLKGYIDKNYNIIINNNIFKSDKNE